MIEPPEFKTIPHQVEADIEREIDWLIQAGYIDEDRRERAIYGKKIVYIGTSRVS